MPISPQEIPSLTGRWVYQDWSMEGYVRTCTCDQFPELVRTDVVDWLSGDRSTAITVAGQAVEFAYQAMADAINEHNAYKD